jgi:hypothetical protein
MYALHAPAGEKSCINPLRSQVDNIFMAAALAANQARIPLAKMAAAETGMGCVEDKVSGVVAEGGVTCRLPRNELQASIAAVPSYIWW